MVEEGIFKCPNCLEEKLTWLTIGKWKLLIMKKNGYFIAIAKILK